MLPTPSTSFATSFPTSHYTQLASLPFLENTKYIMTSRTKIPLQEFKILIFSPLSILSSNGSFRFTTQSKSFTSPLTLYSALSFFKALVNTSYLLSGKGRRKKDRSKEKGKEKQKEKKKKRKGRMTNSQFHKGRGCFIHTCIPGTKMENTFKLSNV